MLLTIRKIRIRKVYIRSDRICREIVAVKLSISKYIYLQALSVYIGIYIYIYLFIHICCANMSRRCRCRCCSFSASGAESRLRVVACRNTYNSPEVAEDELS